MIRATFWALLVVGCGGSCPGAATAENSGAESASASSESKSEAAPAEEQDKPAPSEEAAPPKKNEAEPSKEEGAVENPEFPEGATVSQAIAAVPKGTTRANIDEETLAQPLQTQSVYEPCKVGAQHFKLKVAIWNGRAVGVDVSAPNKMLAACIERQIRGLDWPSKVRSLNTVEYSM